MATVSVRSIVSIGLKSGRLPTFQVNDAPLKVDDQIHWRGKLRHVASGEIRHFRGWAVLILLMLDMLRRHNDQNFVNSHQATGDEN